MILDLIIAALVVLTIMIVWAILLRRVIKHRNSGDMASGVGADYPPSGH